MGNIKSLVRIINQLNYVLTTDQKKRAIFVFLSMLLCSALELIGVSVIYPFLQLMMDEDEIRNKWYINWMFKMIPDISFDNVLVIMCICIIGVYLIKNAVALLCIYAQNRYAYSVQRELSIRMLKLYMKRPYEFFVNTNSSRINQSIIGNTACTYDVLQNMFQFLAESLTVFLIGIYLVYTDYVVAIAAITLSVGCFFLIILAFKKRLKQSGKDMTEASIRSTKECTQAVFGIKEISVMDRRDSFVDKYSEAARKVERISRFYSFLSACPDRILEGICIGGFMGIATARIISGSSPEEFVPVLGTFAMGAFKLLPSMSKMSSRINSIVYEQSRLEMCVEDLKQAKEYEEEQKKKITESEKGVFERRIEFTESLIIKDVCWKYKNSSRIILENLNLSVHKGEAVALIGTSGTGKTTLADIILGLFKPQKGGVYMDGIDIATIPKTWAQIVGYVPQSVYLIDDSIKANIGFGLTNNEINDDMIWRALEEARLDEYVKSLPSGLDTVVGERGVKLSGGQRQRIAIARALYINPDILILDEATSALDTETETAVMESIESLVRQKTLIIIAHRLTTIRNCDRIYEVVDGKAIERDKDSVFIGQ